MQGNLTGGNNALDGKQAMKMYLIIFLIVGVLTVVYFVNFKNDNTKEDNVESNSNDVNEVYDSNSNQSSNVNSNVTSNKPNNVTSNKPSNTTSNKPSNTTSNKPSNTTSNKPNNVNNSTSVSVKSVTVSGNTIVDVGSKIKLNATISPSNATNKGVTWKSSDNGIATVDQNGNVTGVKPGTVYITVTTIDGNKTVNFKVNVKAPIITNVNVPSVFQNFSVIVNTDFDVNEFLAVYPQNGDKNCLTYRSNDTSVATVSSRGVVRGLKVGNVSITVTAPNGVSATMKLRVIEKPPTKLYVYGKNTSIAVNNFEVKVTNIGDETCISSKSCSGKIELEVKVGNRTHTIYTNNGRIKSDDGSYALEAITEDGIIVLKIYELS